uniref:Uncharacterized protein n=1 Tax=Setaria italica TaxID=4555 RepID=K3ZE08_SETIT
MAYALAHRENSLLREDTRALNLWAWTKNPSLIPKVTWLTLTNSGIAVHDGMVPPPSSGPGRRGLTFQVIVHLDLREDPPDRDGRATLHDYKWHCRVSRHHRDDDDYDRRGREEDNWSTRLFRSLSRAPKGRDRDRSESRHGYHDRNAAGGGRRRRERHLHRPAERRARSEPQPRHRPREATPEGRQSCKPPGHDAGEDNDHRSSQHPPGTTNTTSPLSTRLPTSPTRTPPRHQAAGNDTAALLSPTAATTTPSLATPPEPAASPTTLVNEDQLPRLATEVAVVALPPALVSEDQLPRLATEAVVAPSTGSFIDSITRPVDPPLLPKHQQQQATPHRAKKTPKEPTRQMLMKRLGITPDEEKSPEEDLQRFISLFRGPLTDLVIKALVALCGLDGATAVQVRAA